MAKPLPIPGLDPHAALGTNVRAIIAVRAGELLAYDPVFHDESAVTALHDARIAAKRLRYPLELFVGMLGPDGEAVLAEVNALQNDLGIIHDRDVLIATITQRLATLELDRAGASGPLRASLEAVLTRVQEERLLRYQDVSGYWTQHTGGDFRERLARIGAEAAIPHRPA